MEGLSPENTLKCTLKQNFSIRQTWIFEGKIKIQILFLHHLYLRRTLKAFLKLPFLGEKKKNQMLLPEYKFYKILIFLSLVWFKFNQHRRLPLSHFKGDRTFKWKVSETFSWDLSTLQHGVSTTEFAQQLPCSSWLSSSLQLEDRNRISLPKSAAKSQA